MIIASDVFSVPEEVGVRILAREPFRAILAMDKAGVIRRRPPVEVVDPLSECGKVRELIAHDEIEPVEIFAAEIPDAVLVGERAIVIPALKKGRRPFRSQVREGFVVTDSTHSKQRSSVLMEDGRRQFENVHLNAVDGGFKFGSGPRLQVTLPDECVLLTAMEQSNYGSFLLRLVPKIILLKKLGLMGLPMLSQTREWQGQVLHAFGVNLANTESYVRTRYYSARKLIVPSMRPSDFFVDDATRDFLRETTERICHGRKDDAKHERLYVSRLAQGRRFPHHRLCLNEEALIEAMAARGFHIFEPEAHSFEEQVRTFAAARVVVEPGGAGMYNTVFCQPGTTVVSIEPMLNWLTHHINMFDSMGHHYSLVLGGADAGDASVQKRWRADVGAVTGLVERLMG